MIPKIKKYIVVTDFVITTDPIDSGADYPKTFIDKVNKYISENWQPQGGISTSKCAKKSNSGEYQLFSQAMVRYDD